MAGFTGLALGALRGLMAGPKEITFVNYLTQVVINTVTIVGLVSTLFFYTGQTSANDTILNWSSLIVFLVVGVCAMRILANIVASFFWKHLIRWDGLLFLSNFALIVGVVLGIEVTILEPSAFVVVILMLLSLMLSRWVIVCWIRHEVSKVAVPQNEVEGTLTESCDNV